MLLHMDQYSSQGILFVSLEKIIAHTRKGRYRQQRGQEGFRGMAQHGTYVAQYDTIPLVLQ